MANTIRNVPTYRKWLRTPRYKGLLVAGYSRRAIVTDWDDKPIAARREAKHQRAEYERMVSRLDELVSW